MSEKVKTSLIPVPAWPKHHPWPSIAGLRYLIFNADINGFESCIRRVGRRVLIDEQAFFKWCESQPKEAKAG